MINVAIDGPAGAGKAQSQRQPLKNLAIFMSIPALFTELLL